MTLYPNPKDFTPKAVYEEMDRQAAQHRRDRFFFKLFCVAGFVFGFAVFILLLKCLTRR